MISPDWLTRPTRCACGRQCIYRRTEGRGCSPPWSSRSRTSSSWLREFPWPYIQRVCNPWNNFKTRISNWSRDQSVYTNYYLHTDRFGSNPPMQCIWAQTNIENIRYARWSVDLYMCEHLCREHLSRETFWFKNQFPKKSVFQKSKFLILWIIFSIFSIKQLSPQMSLHFNCSQKEKVS